MSHRSLRWVPRRPTRHAVRIPCQVIRERDFALIAEETLDLSEHGMLVRPKRCVLTGEDVIVSFMAPYSRIWVDAEATVSRVIHGRRDGDRGPGLGLCFENIDEVARALLRQNLKSVPPPLPGRRRWSIS